jgi:SpoVK/Ycf46/Vps4 family AAA+-type ATPase
VDLPNQDEREAIWKIVISDFGREPKDFDTVQLARTTDGLTGAEIKSVFFDAMFAAFEEDGDPTDLHIATVLNDVVPLSKLMAENIAALRAWSKGRARMATSALTERRIRKLG